MTIVASVPSRFRLVPAAAALVVVASLVLAGRPLDDGRTPRTAAPSPETVLVPTPVDEPPAPRPALPQAPRRVVAVKNPSRASSPAAAPTAAADTPSGPLISTSTDPLFDVDLIQRVSFPEPEERPFSAAATFASLPHAGLAQQTP